MPLSIYYWLLMFLWLVAGALVGWSSPPQSRFYVGGGSLVLFLLFLILGLKIFGHPVQ